jgi:malate synthase
VQREIDNGKFPDFLPETAEIRESDWKVAPIPKDLLDRRVEITGPVDRKMIINALNSGPVFSWPTSKIRIRRPGITISKGSTICATRFGDDPIRESGGKEVSTWAQRLATLMVRPRGWHLDEKHFLVEGKPISGSLFDFGLFFFHNAAALLEQRHGPLFLPAEDGEPPGGAAVERRLLFCPGRTGHSARIDSRHRADRDHSRGVRNGRDPLRIARPFGGAELRALGLHFQLHQEISQSHPEFVLPDRSQVTMEVHFLSSYVELLIQTCHRRGIHAMGGMAAQIPIRNDRGRQRAGAGESAAGQTA